MRQLIMQRMLAFPASTANVPHGIVRYFPYGTDLNAITHSRRAESRKWKALLPNPTTNANASANANNDRYYSSDSAAAAAAAASSSSLASHYCSCAERPGGIPPPPPCPILPTCPSPLQAETTQQQQQQPRRQRMHDDDRDHHDDAHAHATTLYRHTGDAQYTLHRAMGTMAHYVPMLSHAEYRCSQTHELAIGGSCAFSRLQQRLSADPSSVSRRDTEGNTPLMLACAARQQTDASVGYLLEKSCAHDGRLVNAANRDGLTALHFAVLSGRPGVVRLLLEKRADVDAGICRAAGIDDHSSRRSSRSRRRGPRGGGGRGTQYGLTPLHVSLTDCSSQASFECFEILLDSGADLTVEMASLCHVPQGGPQAASFQRECDCGGCWSHFKVRGFDSVLPPGRMTEHHFWDSRGGALTIAALNDADKHVRRLLGRFSSAGVDRCGTGVTLLDVVGSVDHDGRPAMFFSIANVNFQVFQTLLPLGGDVNRSLLFLGRANALHLLSSLKRNLAGHFTCLWCRKVMLVSDSVLNPFVDALLSHDEIDVEGKDRPYGRTALLNALVEGHEYFCEMLLATGADPLARDREGQSALYLACLLEPPPVRGALVDVLLKTGISHEVVAEPLHRDKSFLMAVYKKRDCVSLGKLYRAGAVSKENLREMLARAAGEVNFEEDDEADEEGMARFRLKLIDLGSSPMSLLGACLIYFSSAVGVGTPAQRTISLRSWVADLDSNLELAAAAASSASGGAGPRAARPPRPDLDPDPDYELDPSYPPEKGTWPLVESMFKAIRLL